MIGNKSPHARELGIGTPNAEQQVAKRWMTDLGHVRPEKLQALEDALKSIAASVGEIAEQVQAVDAAVEVGIAEAEGRWSEIDARLTELESAKAPAPKKKQ